METMAGSVFRRGRPLVIGHRGFRARYPENGVEGVRAALAAGADGVEVDVRPTADGLWVCHHDLRNRGLHITRHRWRELGRWGVASFEAVLEAVPAGRWLFLEIKPMAMDRLEACLPKLAGAIAGRRGRLRILSSSVRVLERAAAAIGAGIPSLIVRRPRHPVIPEGWTLSPHHTLVERLLAEGRPLHPWTVNVPKRLRTLAGLGVASVTTDDPERALECLGEWVREGSGIPGGPAPFEGSHGEDGA